MKSGILNIIIAVIWVSLTQVLSIHNILAGLLIGFILILLFELTVKQTSYTKLILGVSLLLSHTSILFFQELTRLIYNSLLRSNVALYPHILAVDWTYLKESEKKLLLCIIAFMPNTTALNNSENTLYLHVLDTLNPENTYQKIQKHLITPLQRIYT